MVFTRFFRRRKVLIGRRDAEDWRLIVIRVNYLFSARINQITEVHLINSEPSGGREETINGRCVINSWR